jgi:hypothetical protein
MPPRYITLAIVAFWLAATGWMAYREIVPIFRSGEPPPFTIDLTDEVSIADVVAMDSQVSRFGAQTIPWTILLQGEKIGYALTQVHRHEDRTFELQAVLRFQKLELPLAIQVTSLSSSYRVTAAGDLRSLATRVIYMDLTGLFGGNRKDAQVEIGVEAEVQEGQLVPRAYRYAPDLAMGRGQTKTKTALAVALQPIPVPERGAILNTLQPVNRQLGLHDGQTWRVPRLDPLEVVLALLGWGGPPRTHYLHAEVSAAPFTWNGADVPCWRIDYAEPGKKVSARTWVLRKDGRVLQQEARHEAMELVLRRELPGATRRREP